MTPPREHGGGIDAAIAAHGGARRDWLDLSTGINPVPYPLPPLPASAWTDLPDRGAFARLDRAARMFWAVPDGAEIVVAGGASALIAAIPGLWEVTGDQMPPPARVAIPGPTYNEHAAAFDAAGWRVDAGATDDNGRGHDCAVIVNPNNPDGRRWTRDTLPPAPRRVIDESFCDETPDQSLIGLATQPDHIILKSFGKFWGLAGLRLGFAICPPQMAAKLRQRLGPWAASGPALAVAASALEDPEWARATRMRLQTDAERLDQILTAAGMDIRGGTGLFRLAETAGAARIARNLAASRILVRQFPYAPTWLRFGLPGDEPEFGRLTRALGS